jgi:hypothetical protein
VRKIAMATPTKGTVYEVDFAHAVRTVDSVRKSA